MLLAGIISPAQGQPSPGFEAALQPFLMEFRPSFLGSGAPWDNYQVTGAMEVVPDPLVEQQVAAARTHITTCCQCGYDLQNYSAGNKKLITPEELYGHGITDTGYTPGQPVIIVIPGFILGTSSDGIWRGGQVDESFWAVEMAREISRCGTSPNVLIWDWLKDATGGSPYGQPRANAGDSAGDLACLLSYYLAAHPDHGPLQLLGDNLGSLVALQTADLLEQQPLVDVDQVTLLDPLGCETYEIQGDYFIDSYIFVISTPGEVFVSPDVNVYLNGWSSLMDPHEVPREWYAASSIRYADAEDNVFGFYWSPARSGSRSDASVYYTGYLEDDRLAAGDYDSYITEAVSCGYWQAPALMASLYDAAALGRGEYVRAANNKRALLEMNYQQWLAGQPCNVIQDPLDGQTYAVYLAAHSPVYLYQSLNIPPETQYLQVDYSVSAADHDAYLAVLLNDELIYYQPLEVQAGQSVRSPALYLGDYAGTDATVTVYVDDPDNSAVGAHVAFRGLTFLQAYTYDVYYFQFTFESGDYYSGSLYADSLQGYYEGWTETVEDELGGLGVYTITGAGPGAGDPGKGGWVYVDSYYDYESGLSHTPVNYAQELAAGAGYLGSEQDYIIQSGEPAFFFGAGPDGKIYEADLGACYDFIFTYEGGDYYTGVVYAAPDYYFVGQTWDAVGSGGIIGGYEISRVSYGEEVARGGQVWVTEYYDAQSGLFFAPLGGDRPLGYDYLESESGFIVTDKAPQYHFHSTSQEANLLTGRVNSYRFTYSGGDYYTGAVYADPSSYRYYLGYTEYLLDENGETGFYEITGVAAGTTRDSRKFGQVSGTGYFDAESGKTYKPLGGGSLGTGYLGSESGYIVRKNIPYLRFGAFDGVHREADVAAQYTFSFYYGNGDYYQGTVYALGRDYYTGFKKFQDDETTLQTGTPGYYEITAAKYSGYSNKLGQVGIHSYYDKESGKTYRPRSKGRTVGTNYLGSEYDYIIKKNVEKYYFGGGYYEADAL